MAAGSAGAHLLLVAATPVLTRLYDPAAFGVLGVFVGAAAMLGMIVTGRYQFGIPVVRTDGEAANLLALCLLSGFLTAVTLSIVLYVFDRKLGTMLGMGEFSYAIWFLLPQCILMALVFGLDMWLLRRRRVGSVALSVGLRAAGQAGLQILLAPLVSGPLALITGYVGGELARIAWLVRSSDKRLSALAGAVSLRRLRTMARRHWRYPLLSAPADLLQSATRMMPTILLSALYGPYTAGQFLLSQRITEIPMKLAANAASKSFLVNLTDIGRGDHLAFAYRVVGFLVPALACFSAFFFVFGEEVFALVFGPQWQMAGEFAGWMVFLAAMRFLTITVSQSMNVYRRQDIQLAWSAGAFGVMLASITAGRWAGLPVTTIVSAYAFGGVLIESLYLGHMLWCVRAAHIRRREGDAESGRSRRCDDDGECRA